MRRLWGKRRPAVRRPRKKACKHYDDVASAAERVLSGDLPPSRQAAEALAEEYLLLHLEFKALMTHLEDA